MTVEEMALPWQHGGAFCGFQRIPATYSNLMAATVPT
jgi:hypothetical protein